MSNYQIITVQSGAWDQEDITLYYVSLDLPFEQVVSLKLFSITKFEESDDISITPNFKVSGVIDKCYLINEELCKEFMRVSADVLEKRYSKLIPLKMIQVNLSATTNKIKKQFEISTESEKIIKARIEQKIFAPNKKPIL